MKETRLSMGMPVTVEVADAKVTKKDIENIFVYFKLIDRRFSTYKKDSEISKINRREVNEDKYSEDMKTVLYLSEKTKQETRGYFDIKKDGQYDPSGLVKGWAIYNAANILRKKDFHNFYVEAGGDIEIAGQNSMGKIWSIGIQNPFNAGEIVKVLLLSDCGIATSGTYLRGQHIYNPHNMKQRFRDVVSITIIGPNAYEADRFATAAFAMGRKGIQFVEQLPQLEGYMIDGSGIATMTSNFKKYLTYD